MQMLFYPLEEDVNMSSVTVQFAYRDGFQRIIVRQEPIACPLLKVFINNESGRIRI